MSAIPNTCREVAAKKKQHDNADGADDTVMTTVRRYNQYATCATYIETKLLRHVDEENLTTNTHTHTICQISPKHTSKPTIQQAVYNQLRAVKLFDFAIFTLLLYVNSVW